jgi:hypothetical protein
LVANFSIGDSLADNADTSRGFLTGFVQLMVLMGFLVSAW